MLTIGSSMIGARLRYRVDERLAARRDERDFLRVHRVVLAVVDGDAHVLHRIAGDRARARAPVRTPFSTAGMKLSGMTPPLTSSTNSKPAAARQRLDAQVHLAELSRAAGLLLVAAVAFGVRVIVSRYGDLRRPRRRPRPCTAAAMRSSFDAHVQFAQAAHHGLVRRRVVLDHQTSDPRLRACAALRRASARRRACFGAIARPCIGVRELERPHVDAGPRRASRAARR